MQSDPYFEVSKAQEGGSPTVVYRSETLKKTLSPKCAYSTHAHYLMYTDTLYMLSTWCMYVCTASSLCRLVTLLCACAALPLLYVGVLYVTRLTPACMHTLLVLLSLMNVTTPHVTTVNRWKGTTITAQKLCSGDWDRTLYFTVWDWNRCVRTYVYVCMSVHGACLLQG